MRYKLDADGYISAVSFGCALDGCTEYTGTIPSGYNTLDDWSTYACINAYYIDSNGNLALDTERLAEIRQKEAQEKIDNAPVLRKDLYGSDEVLDSQYLKKTETGDVIIVNDAKTIAPRVKVTGVTTSSLHIYTQEKNLLPFSVKEQTISGMTIGINENGGLKLSGTATEDIELTVAGSETNTTPLFALKGGRYYSLYLGGYECELRYYDGETTSQMYSGASGPLTLSESIVVTQVIIKIPKGTTSRTYSKGFTLTTMYMAGFYADSRCKSLSIDFSDILAEFPDGTAVDYVVIENGKVSVSIEGVEIIVGSGNVGLFSGYNTIYALEDVTLEVEYSTNNYDGNVGGLQFTESGLTSTVEAWINPTAEDVQKVADVVTGEATVTDEMYTIMDINCDGTVSLSDWMAWQRILLGTSEIDYHVSTYGYKPVLSDVTLTISPDEPRAVVRISGTNCFGTYVESCVGINSLCTSGTVTGGVVKTTSGANLDDSIWKECTITLASGITNYNNTAKAYYRYMGGMLEIMLEGTPVLSSSSGLSAGATIATITGLPVTPSYGVHGRIWDANAKVMRGITLSANGTLYTQVALSAGGWYSLYGSNFKFKV